MNIKQTDKILVIAPHPDDESLGCGGFMLKYAKQIDSFCFLSSGIEPDAKKKSDVRMVEWNVAQKFIGCKNLGICELYGTKPLLPRIKDSMDYYLKTLDTSKYDYIFMPHFDDNHPEHRYIATDLMRQILLRNGFKKNLKICCYEVWTPLIDPNDFVDIDAKKKLKLLDLYKTQWTVCDLPKKIVGLNCYRGIKPNGFTDYAEAFFVIPVKKYMKLTRKHSLTGWLKRLVCGD
ncbi:MAG: PIG-L family deacetylase [Alphaproteobacteria bacterium]|nr:PIG-L family deacetylase [Alphaproteobacteria bacterium]